MKKIVVYIDKEGQVVVEYEPTLDAMEVFQALGISMNAVYTKIMEQEASKRTLEAKELEDLIRLLAKQKNPKLN